MTGNEGFRVKHPPASWRVSSEVLDDAHSLCHPDPDLSGEGSHVVKQCNANLYNEALVLSYVN